MSTDAQAYLTLALMAIGVILFGIVGLAIGAIVALGIVGVIEAWR